MGVLRVVIRIGILWVISLVVAVAGMALGHRIVTATDRGEAARATPEATSAISVGDEPTR
jgi:hypothetical protein